MNDALVNFRLAIIFSVVQFLTEIFNKVGYQSVAIFFIKISYFRPFYLDMNYTFFVIIFLVLQKFEDFSSTGCYFTTCYLIISPLWPDRKKNTWCQLFHMVNSVTCMNVGTSLEKAIKKC